MLKISIFTKFRGDSSRNTNTGFAPGRSTRVAVYDVRVDVVSCTSSARREREDVTVVHVYMYARSEKQNTYESDRVRAVQVILSTNIPATRIGRAAGH